jgi:transposase InsO family protein
LCRRVLEQNWTVRAAAEAVGLSERSGFKWLARYRAEGPDGLVDRSSRPHRSPRATPPQRRRAVMAFRRLGWTGVDIAEVLSMPPSTVSKLLAAEKMGRRWRLNPEPPNRYCRRHPGELIHIDIKKLGRFDRPGKRIWGHKHRSRGAGWEFVYVAVDDTTRLAYAEILDNEQALTAVGFLKRAVAFFDTWGVRTQRVLTDNGSPFRSRLWADTCRDLGVSPRRTRPYRPQTNGKAERFIQTMLRRWAYRHSYPTSHDRATALPAFLDWYNHRRPHGALNKQTPASQLTG